MVLVYSSVSSFFLCKQKTAYEMRISDWSSDVCSSDLTVEIRVKGMSAAQFGDWFKSALDVQEKLISANPEHYRIQWNVSPSEDPEGFGIISVTEELGGILNKCDIKWGGTELVSLPLDPEFPRRVLGSLRLENGSAIGQFMNEFRDYDGGMDARLGMLMPKVVPEHCLANPRESLLIE